MSGNSRGRLMVRDLWNYAAPAPVQDDVAAGIDPHGAALYTLTPLKRTRQLVDVTLASRPG